MIILYKENIIEVTSTAISRYLPEGGSVKLSLESKVLDDNKLPKMSMELSPNNGSKVTIDLKNCLPPALSWYYSRFGGSVYLTISDVPEGEKLNIEPVAYSSWNDFVFEPGGPAERVSRVCKAVGVRFSWVSDVEAHT